MKVVDKIVCSLFNKFWLVYVNLVNKNFDLIRRYKDKYLECIY